MNTFKEGDRVLHAYHGSAIVVEVGEARKLVTIQPTRQSWVTQVHPVSLTPEPKPKPVVSGKIKIGDRVSHRLHRDGTVIEINTHSGLYTVGLGGSRAYRALEHQITPAQPAPKFTVQVLFTNGEGYNSEVARNRQEAESYLTQLADWDNVESITINRVKG